MNTPIVKLMVVNWECSKKLIEDLKRKKLKIEIICNWHGSIGEEYKAFIGGTTTAILVVAQIVKSEVKENIVNLCVLI